MTKYATGFGSAGALTGTEVLQVVRSGADLQAPVSAFVTPGYIDGLILRWVSGTAITLGTGSAYIPSLGYAIRVTSDIAKTGLTIAANTNYHFYLFLNGSSADWELSTTAPTSAYYATARTKTGDTSRRYLGSVISDASGLLYNFTVYGNIYRYVTGGGAPYRIVNNGMATTRTNVDISSLVPSTASTVYVKVQNSSTSTSSALFFDSSASGLSGTAAFIIIGQPSTQLTGEMPLMGSQIVQYFYGAAPATQGAFIDVLGYQVPR